MKLNEFIQDQSLEPLVVKSVTSDSRKVEPGCVFVAIKGISTDGHDFLDEAFSKGALFCIGEKDYQSQNYLKVADSRQTLSELASRFYLNPTKNMTIIVITGTSGKTTSTYLLESIFIQAGYQVGVIGTIETRYAGKKIEATHTTPDPISLQKILAEMKSENIDCVIMEVSSHALDQKRAHGILFDAVLFTNLSSEHLDYHKDLESYFDAKKILFTDLIDFSKKQGKAPKAVFSLDSYSKKMYEQTSTNAEKIFVPSGFKSELDSSGIKLNISGIEIQSSLVGDFNLNNILGAYQIAKSLGLNSDVIKTGIESLSGVPGRVQKVDDYGTGIFVYVDYAHKPDALEKVLHTLLKVKSKNLYTVVGCGGDRDQEKRPVMGKIAVSLSDFVWFTSDNPRTEDPHQILSQIENGAKEVNKNNYEVIENRKKAITSALQKAQSGDIVLIAGKGHEDYQIVGQKKLHFDDREIAKEALKNK